MVRENLLGGVARPVGSIVAQDRLVEVLAEGGLELGTDHLNIPAKLIGVDLAGLDTVLEDLLRTFHDLIQSSVLLGVPEHLQDRLRVLQINVQVLKTEVLKNITNQGHETSTHDELEDLRQSALGILVVEDLLNLIGLTLGGATEGQADEIQKILDDEDTKGALSEILELIMSTRLVSLVGDILQNLSFEDLNIDLENPQSILEMLRNPQEHAGLNEIMERAKQILEDRVQTGKINPNELRRDIEMIRAKFQSSFGKYLNEAILGDDGADRTGNTSQQILSNHPDARRARMLARLQKKQKLRPSK